MSNQSTGDKVKQIRVRMETYDFLLRERSKVEQAIHGSASFDDAIQALIKRGKE